MTVQFVYADDWMGVYLDGYLEYEGHSLDERDLLELLRIPYTSKEVDYDWIEDRGYLPRTYHEVEPHLMGDF